MTALDSAFQCSIDGITVPGILIGHRIIAPGDEAALLAEEREVFATSVEKVRRASGAARIVARDLMTRLGQAPCAVLKAASGAPIWPEGIVGSLAHDARIAIAALGPRGGFSSLGIDIEPSEMLDPDLLSLVATKNERQRIAYDPFRGRLLFVIKEAVYKAVHPLDGIFLEHHDVEVDLNKQTAAVRNGRSVRFRYAVTSHIVALAFI